MWDQSFFVSDGLVAGHDDGVHDVFDGGAAREVVDRGGETLENGAYGSGSGDALHEFVGDVADLERREDEGVGLSCDFAAGAFMPPTAGTMAASLWSSPSILSEGSISWASFCSFDNPCPRVHVWRFLCREADHGDCRVESGDIFCCLCRGDRDLCELLCGGIRNNRAVGEDEHLVFSEGAGLGRSMMKAPLTTEMPGFVLSTWKAARSTWDVGLSAPATMASPSPRLIIRQPRYRGLSTVSRASSMDMPFFLRNS